MRIAVFFVLQSHGDMQDLHLRKSGTRFATREHKKAPPHKARGEERSYGILFECQEELAALDGLALLDVDMMNFAIGTGDDGGFHLHGLDDEQGLIF